MLGIKTIDNVFYRALGQNIRNYREKRNMTQKELASEIGVSRPQLINYEYGYVKLKPNMYVRICKALDMPMNFDVLLQFKTGN